MVYEKHITCTEKDRIVK